MKWIKWLLNKKKTEETLKRKDRRIHELEGAVRQYYMAIHEVRSRIKDRHGLTGTERIYVTYIGGNEEIPQACDFEALCELVEGLPQKDYGC